SKASIDIVRHRSLIMYHINLIAMDIYVGSSPVVGFDAKLARFGFVKTYLMTRIALGLAIDADRIQAAFAAWYHMLGLLVSCHKGDSFVVMREPVEMTRTWLLEAMLHLTSMRQGQFLTGRNLVNPIPATLSYLRFNFGEQSFL